MCAISEGFGWGEYIENVQSLSTMQQSSSTPNSPHKCTLSIKGFHMLDFCTLISIIHLLSSSEPAHYGNHKTHLRCLLCMVFRVNSNHTLKQDHV